MMKATELEFRHRAVLNLVQFWLAFQVYVFDHRNIVWSFSHWENPRRAVLARLVFLFGALLVGAGAAIRTWATAYLGPEVVFDLQVHSERLVADGPYRYVRNPLYLGSLLLCIGLGLLANRLGFLILVTAGTIRILRLIGREEENLGRQQGERFFKFTHVVPRLVPSMVPRIPAGGFEPQWRDAFRAEMWMWGFFATMIGFTTTLRASVAWTLGLLSGAVWIMQRAVNQWVKAKKA
jgi:protein-S-isoprenylcysteine O-methyltransferase Ste14